MLSLGTGDLSSGPDPPSCWLRDPKHRPSVSGHQFPYLWSEDVKHLILNLEVRGM